MVNTGASRSPRPHPRRAGGLRRHAAIAGVPGTAARLRHRVPDTAGSVAPALLPTGNVVDEVDGIEVTCVDNGMPTS